MTLYRKQNVHGQYFFRNFSLRIIGQRLFLRRVRAFLKKFLKGFVYQRPTNVAETSAFWNGYLSTDQPKIVTKRDTHGKLPVLKIIRFICCRPGSVEKTTYLHFMSVQERRRAMYGEEILTTLAIFEKLKCSNTQKCFREKRLSVICWFITF